MMKFVKDEFSSSQLVVPFFEDARADIAPYYSIKTQERTLKHQIEKEMSKLGGIIVRFDAGQFDDKGKKRYGYQIEFSYSGAPGAIRVVGLPIKRKETVTKVRTVKAQVLAIVRDWLKTSVTAIIFNPGANPLLLHLLTDGEGSDSFADYIRVQQSLPRLNAGEMIVIEE